MYVNQIILLPRYFKLVGLAIVIACIVIRFSGISMPSQYGAYAPSALLLGIFIIAVSRSKVEDELTLLIRLKALGGAFVFGIIEVILSPVFRNWFTSNVDRMDAGRLIFKMLFFYFLLFYFFRRQQK